MLVVVISQSVSFLSVSPLGCINLSRSRYFLLSRRNRGQYGHGVLRMRELDRTKCVRGLWSVKRSATPDNNFVAFSNRRTIVAHFSVEKTMM